MSGNPDRGRECQAAWPGDAPDTMTAHQAEQVLLFCGGDLGIPNLRFQVERALSTASVTTVVQNYLTALRHGLGRSLTNHLLDFIRHNFADVSETKGFLNCAPEVVTVMLRDSHLHVNSELDVYIAALKWLDYNKQGRLKYAAQVMMCIRFSFLSPADIVKYVEPNRGLFEGDGKDILLSIYRTHMMILAGLQKTRVEPPRNYQTSADFLGMKHVYFAADAKQDAEVADLHSRFKDMSEVADLHSRFQDMSDNHCGSRAGNSDAKPHRFHFSLRDACSQNKSSNPLYEHDQFIGQHVENNYSERGTEKASVYNHHIEVGGKDNRGLKRYSCRPSLSKRVKNLSLQRLSSNDGVVLSQKEGSFGLGNGEFSQQHNLDKTDNASMPSLRQQIQASWQNQGDPATFDGNSLKHTRSFAAAEATQQTSEKRNSLQDVSQQIEKDKPTTSKLSGYFNKSYQDRRTEPRDNKHSLDIINSVNDSLDKLLSNFQNISRHKRRDTSSKSRQSQGTEDCITTAQSHASPGKQVRKVSFDLDHHVSTFGWNEDHGQDCVQPTDPSSDPLTYRLVDI